VFDAAAGFGGYRESGYGREGGKEGLFEYVRPRWMAEAHGTIEEPIVASSPGIAAEEHASGFGGTGLGLPAIDRTAKLYIGGKQARPDGGYSQPVHGADGTLLGQVGLGNRKDIRNAVEAAHAASGWARQTAHLRAQVLYYLAENLSARQAELAARLAKMTGHRSRSQLEVELAIERLFTYAAWADKYDGLVHATPHRNVTVAMNEPIGTIGIVTGDAAPLLQLVSLVAPAIAMGNTVVVVPSEKWPLAATDLYQVLDTSDLPGGVVNIVTGTRAELTPVLAGHDGIDSIWYHGPEALTAQVEKLSAGNMKRTFATHGRERNWFDGREGEGREFLREATQVKNIWVPYGE
jgi:aldehyde dehydrogenase (NAD+)